MVVPMLGRVLLAIGAAFAVASASSQEVNYRVVALTGDPVPGPVDGTLRHFQPSSGISQDGTVVLSGIVDRVDGEGTIRTLWVYGDDELLPVASTLGQTPGVSGTFDSFTNVAINSSGNFALRAYYDPAGSTRSEYGLWQYVEDELQLVAKVGDVAPGTDQRAFEYFERPQINDLNQVLFPATLSSGPVDERDGIWLRSENQLELVVRAGSVAPGTDGALFESFGYPIINQAGDIVFGASLDWDSGDVTNITSNGVWVYRAGILEMLVRDGESVPGFQNTNFVMSGIPHINDSGQVLFYSALRSTDGSINPDNNETTWVYDSGVMSLVSREQDAVPGTGGARLAGIDTDSICNSGDVIMELRLELELPQVTNSNDRGIWIYRDGEYRFVVREGDRALGIPGAKFRTVEDYAMNDSGQVVVLMRHNDSSGETQTGTSLYLVHPDSTEPILLLASGQEFNVSNDPNIDDIRTITSVSFYGGSADDAAFRSSMNNAGMIGLYLRFTDDSVARIAATIMCTADTNGDGSLTPADFTAWINAFNNDLQECDQNSDNECTATDFTAWIANYNAGCP